MPKPRKNYFQKRNKFYGPRSNHWIRSVDVQVISSSGKNLGVLPIKEAIETAKREGLDLVEISSKVTPPICKIMAIGKYKYDMQKKANKAKKNQKIATLKELKLRPMLLILLNGLQQESFAMIEKLNLKSSLNKN